MATIDTAQRMLEEAQKAFRQNLRDPYLYAQILTAKTVTVVYDAIAKLQETMAPNGLLRGLGRLKPLLDRLSEFSFSIEALLSPSSSLLALIWGPIKAILTHSRRDIHVFSKNIDMLAMIGDALPPFGEVFQRFTTDGGLREILALFYQELLEFYRITLVLLMKKCKLGPWTLCVALRLTTYLTWVSFLLQPLEWISILIGQVMRRTSTL